MARSPKPAIDPADRKRLGALRLIWGMAAGYRGHIAAALVALLIASAATLAIPYGFKRVIDRGFGAGRLQQEQVAARPVAVGKAQISAARSRHGRFDPLPPRQQHGNVGFLRSVEQEVPHPFAA